jgi:hypothetical protein
LTCVLFNRDPIGCVGERELNSNRHKNSLFEMCYWKCRCGETLARVKRTVQ